MNTKRKTDAKTNAQAESKTFKKFQRVASVVGGAAWTSALLGALLANLTGCLGSGADVATPVNVPLDMARLTQAAWQKLPDNLNETDRHQLRFFADSSFLFLETGSDGRSGARMVAAKARIEGTRITFPVELLGWDFLHMAEECREVDLRAELDLGDSSGLAQVLRPSVLGDAGASDVADATSGMARANDSTFSALRMDWAVTRLGCRTLDTSSVAAGTSSHWLVPECLEVVVLNVAEGEGGGSLQYRECGCTECELHSFALETAHDYPNSLLRTHVPVPLEVSDLWPVVDSLAAVR